MSELLRDTPLMNVLRTVTTTERVPLQDVISKYVRSSNIEDIVCKLYRQVEDTIMDEYDEFIGTHSMAAFDVIRNDYGATVDTDEKQSRIYAMVRVLLTQAFFRQVVNEVDANEEMVIQRIEETYEQGGY